MVEVSEGDPDMGRVGWTKRMVWSDGVPIALRDSGTDAPALVLLNGLGTPQGVWRQVAARLAGRYRIITFDYRGHGQSGRAAEYSFETLLDDVAAVLTETEVREPTLCGWSLGADLALWHAATDPDVRRVVALDGGIPADPIEPVGGAVPRMESWPLRLAGGLARLFGVGVKLSPGQLASMVGEVQERRRGILAAYAALGCPVEVALARRIGPAVRGDAGADSDRVWREGARRLTAAHPEIPVQWLDSDHAMPIHVPDQIAELVAEA